MLQHLTKNVLAFYVNVNQTDLWDHCGAILACDGLLQNLCHIVE